MQRIGILGLPRSGKSTLFEVLMQGAGAHAAQAGREQLGVVRVPDERVDRLAAICAVDAEGAECDRTLREVYLTIKQLQLEHHAEAVRAGRKPDNIIDTRALRPLARANLQEALREVAAAQSRFPRLAAGWRGL